MKSLARMHVWYPGINKDIEQLVNTCEKCKSVKNHPPKLLDHSCGFFDRVNHKGMEKELKLVTDLVSVVESFLEHLFD